MLYYSLECEAPSGGYGPNAVLVYDEKGQYIERVDYLDIIFDVWLGGELVQDVQCFCVTAALWDYLNANGIKGVSVRTMAVTIGDRVNQFHPNRTIPQFLELVLPRDLHGHRVDGWKIDRNSIPNADMFTGTGLPLFVTERARELLTRYGVTSVEFEEAVGV